MHAETGTDPSDAPPARLEAMVIDPFAASTLQHDLWESMSIADVDARHLPYGDRWNALTKIVERWNESHDRIEPNAAVLWYMNDPRTLKVQVSKCMPETSSA